MNISIKHKLNSLQVDLTVIDHVRLSGCQFGSLVAGLKRQTATL